MQTVAFSKNAALTVFRIPDVKTYSLVTIEW
jgi:hypothetical protein